MSPTTTRSAREVDLATRIRLADGRIFSGALSPERHCRIHLGLLHADSDGYVEIAAGRRPPGAKLRVTTRKDPGHFLPGGTSGGERWLDALLELVANHAARGEEVFVAPAVRHARGAEQASRQPHELAVDRRRRARRAARGPRVCCGESRRSSSSSPPARAGCIATGGCAARCAPTRSSRRTSGSSTRSAMTCVTAARCRPSPTPPARTARASCAWRAPSTARAGAARGSCRPTSCTRGGRWTSCSRACPTHRVPPRARRRRHRCAHDDPYKRIAPAEYFRRLAGIEVPASGLVRCPSPTHDDATPSCHVGRDASEGFCCHGCGIGGAIYDLASALEGGATGRWLRGDAFRRARERVRLTFDGA